MGSIRGVQVSRKRELTLLTRDGYIDDQAFRNAVAEFMRVCADRIERRELGCLVSGALPWNGREIMITVFVPPKFGSDPSQELPTQRFKRLTR